MITPGTVHIDDNGVETFTPDNATNAAKSLYQLLITYATGHTLHTAEVTPAKHHYEGGKHVRMDRPVVKMVHRPIPVSVEIKRHQAAQANLMAAWTVAVVRAELAGQ